MRVDFFLLGNDIQKRKMIIKVNVKYHGDTFEYFVDPHDDLARLKELIVMSTGALSHQMRLIFNKKQMWEDDKLLSEYGVVDGSEILLSVDTKAKKPTYDE